MPDKDKFLSVSEYYSTLFHELAHSTGHKSRLDRNLDGYRGGKDYAREELVAEFTSSFLCGVAQIEKPVIENQAAYIANWKATLTDSKNYSVLIQAAAAAEKAANYVLNSPAAEFVAAA